MRRFLITGCPRSGTKYIWTVLEQCGIDCKWENRYHLNTHSQPDKWKDAEPSGEISWLSVPYLDKVPDDVVVIHQTRDPRLVLPSMKRWRQCETGKDFAVMRRLNKDLLGGRATQEDYETTWCIMNEMIERRSPAIRYRIEDIDDEIWKLLHVIDAKYDLDTVYEALKNTKRTINSGWHGRRGDAYTLKTERIIELAERYGY